MEAGSPHEYGGVACRRSVRTLVCEADADRPVHHRGASCPRHARRGRNPSSSPTPRRWSRPHPRSRRVCDRNLELLCECGEGGFPSGDRLCLRAGEEDAIIFYRPTRRVPVEYYVHGRTGRFPDSLYPAAVWGEFDLIADYRSERPSMAHLADELSRRQTVWLFLGTFLRTAERRRTLAEIEALVEKGRLVAEVRRYPGIELRRYQAHAGAR